MKKLVLLTLLLVVSGITVWLLPGEDVDAAQCVRCLPGGTTGPAWGFGSTCATATTDAINQASASIPCLSCRETPIGVLPCDDTCSNPTVCYNPYGQWRVDMKITYKCFEDICL